MEMIKPSDVTEPLGNSVWQKSEKETIATNILKLARYKNKDHWLSFTWGDYVKFCSHTPSHAEKVILDGFAETGYLKKASGGAYHFTRKIIGVYMQYTDEE